MNNTRFAEIINSATGHWENIVRQLGVSIPADGKHGACPKCGGKDRFRFDDKDGRGTWFCNNCGNGDGLDLIKHVFSISAGQAINRVKEVIPSVTANNTPARKEAGAKLERTPDYWRRLLSRVKTGESEYLKAKGLSGYQMPLTTKPVRVGGAECPAGSLMVPLVNAGGELTGVQVISPDGTKSQLSGTRMAGSFASVGEYPKEAPEKIVVSEGYATAISCSLLSDGWHVAALSETNLRSVAIALRERFPAAQIVIAGDNDFQDGKPNKGREYAVKAALAVKGFVCIPPGRAKADWDDYRRNFGLQRATEAFREEIFNPGETESRLPPGFRLTKEFLWCERTRNDGTESGQVQQVKVCSPLRVTAITCDADGGNFGRLLEWEDSNGVKREWSMPMRCTAGQGQEIREVLLENGMHFIAQNGIARSALMEYISSCRPVRRATCVDKTGWYSGSYVLNGEVIGSDAGAVVYQSSQSSKNDFRVSGDLDEWRENVGKYCVGNSRLVFCVSLAFAAPLLTLLGIGGGGYHLKGESTDGKTTTMKVAASVCGGADYWKTWRATGNGLEGVAMRRNDAALMLDEISEVDGREASRVAYMLGNGQGRVRARQDGSLREPVQWRLLFLSTGEVSIAEHAAEAGEKRTGAGVGVRMVQIPSDTGKYGAFEELHGFDTGKEFAEYMEHSSNQYHGAAFRGWLNWLVNDLVGATSKAKALHKEYERTLTPENAGAQVGRIVGRFALMAAAGELATEAGLTGWKPGEAYNGAKKCLDAWIKDRGHSANQEDVDALEKVRRFITANLYTRFADWNDEHNRPMNMVGFRRMEKGANNADGELTIYILLSGWKEICGTSDNTKAAKLCRDAGWLNVDKDEKRTQKTVRLPEIGAKKVYVFNSNVVG